MSRKQKKLLIRIILSALFLVFAAIIENMLKPEKIFVIFMYLIPYFISGYDVLLGFFKKISRGKVFDEEFLMSVATFGAFIIGEFPEAVFVMIFYQTGELFQNIAVGKSRKSISDLLDICPEFAVVLRDEEETVSPEEVEIGEIILVRPGEKIPLDGIVVKGESSLNMCALTGESAPCEVWENVEVKAGSINLSGILEIKVLKEYSESTASKIMELVENSSLNKAKTEKFLSRFAAVYTPAVVICATLLAVIPSIITGDVREWIYRALIFLVVSCPCALVISVPLTFFSGIGAASSKGVLVKGSDFLELLGKAETFVFDKTGTLTTGEFSVSEIYPENNVSKEELLEMTASAEYYSSHPLARGVVNAVKNAAVPESTKEHSGFGIEAETEYGTVFAGSLRFLQNKGIEIFENSQKGTGIFVAKDNIYQGFIKLSDTPKENVISALKRLRKNGVKRIIMLTGDNKRAAKETAEKLGITEYKAELLPSDKADFVKSLCENKNKKSTVVFVGDGINDAPVLALSDVGISMGGVGSDAAIEASDIVIMDDNIEKCALGMEIASKTGKIVKQNIVMALVIKFAVLIFAAFGFTNMWVGVFADVGVAVAAILNAMRKKDRR